MRVAPSRRAIIPPRLAFLLHQRFVQLEASARLNPVASPISTSFLTTGADSRHFLIRWKFQL
jgi:hypothetical protein